MITELEGFATRLKWLLGRDNLSYLRLGRAIDVDRETIRSWANAEHYPNGYYLMKLARYFHVSIDFLMFGEDTKNENK